MIQQNCSRRSTNRSFGVFDEPVARRSFASTILSEMWVERQTVDNVLVSFSEINSKEHVKDRW